jgi:CYTH domain
VALSAVHINSYFLKNLTDGRMLRTLFPIICKNRSVSSNGRRKLCVTLKGTDSGSQEDETERKFVLTPLILQNISRLSGQTIPQLHSMVDVYFDDSFYSLTTRDMWLRRRNDTYELKWPRSEQNQSNGDQKLSGIDFYHESTSWTVITEALSGASVNLENPVLDVNSSSSDVEYWLKSNGLTSFATIKSSRQRYRLELPAGKKLISSTSDSTPDTHVINVDIDDVEYMINDDVSCSDPRLRYSIGEIELIKPAENHGADEALLDVFKQLEISTEPVRGKVLEYLSRFRPNHYIALESSGLIAGKLR